MQRRRGASRFRCRARRELVRTEKPDLWKIFCSIVVVVVVVIAVVKLVAVEARDHARRFISPMMDFSFANSLTLALLRAV